MSNIFKQAFFLLTGTDNFSALGLNMPKTASQPSKPIEHTSERELIQKESEIGVLVFGPVPEGHHRQFFNLDPLTWIWYEKWTDPFTGRDKSTTIRYEIHDNGVMKVQDGVKYQFLEGHDLDNFMTAIAQYYDQVMRAVYHSDPTTGQPFDPPSHFAN